MLMERLLVSSDESGMFGSMLLLTRFVTAAALTAGLAAYFLRLRELNLLTHDDGTPVPHTPQGIKDYLLAKSWSRTQDDGIERKAIYNGYEYSERACQWNPLPPALVRRNETGPMCRVPKPETATIKTTLTTSPSKKPTAGISHTKSPATTTFPKQSSTTLKPSPTPTKNVTPLSIGRLVCNKESTLAGYAPINGDAAKDFSAKICIEWQNNNGTMKSGDDAIIEVGKDSGVN